MFNSTCVISRKLLFYLSAVITFCLLTFLTNCNILPTLNLNCYEVWHHMQTIGVLVLRGGQRTLVECRLMMIEGRSVLFRIAPRNISSRNLSK